MKTVAHLADRLREAEAKLAVARETLDVLANHFEHGWSGPTRSETIDNVARIAREALKRTKP